MKALAALTILVAGACASAVPAAVKERPPGITKTCGSIDALGRRLAVDIDEGRFPLPCAAARRVMSRFLARHPGYGVVRSRALAFTCYRSRPDGVGWDYHCSYQRGTRVAGYVDIGAGRRSRRG